MKDIYLLESNKKLLAKTFNQVLHACIQNN